MVHIAQTVGGKHRFNHARRTVGVKLGATRGDVQGDGIGFGPRSGLLLDCGDLGVELFVDLFCLIRNVKNLSDLGHLVLDLGEGGGSRRFLVGAHGVGAVHLDAGLAQGVAVDPGVVTDDEVSVLVQDRLGGHFDTAGVQLLRGDCWDGLELGKGLGVVGPLLDPTGPCDDMVEHPESIHGGGVGVAEHDNSFGNAGEGELLVAAHDSAGWLRAGRGRLLGR